MKIGTVCNTYCLPNWLTSGIICCRQYMPPLHPTFLRHTRHSRRTLLDGELNGVWQTLRFQDSKTPYSRRTRTCIRAFLLSSGSFWPCHRRRSDVNGHLVEWTHKNLWITTMTSDRLSSLALIHEHKDMNIDVDRVINVFASEKCRYFF